MEETAYACFSVLVLDEASNPIKCLAAEDIPLSRQAIIKKTVALFREPFPSLAQIARATNLMLDELQQHLLASPAPVALGELPLNIREYLDFGGESGAMALQWQSAAE